MQGVNIPFGALVKATWLDSTALAGWIKEAEHHPYKVETIHSAGFVVRARTSEEELTLSTSLANSVNQAIDPISIPWVSITELKVLEDPPDGTD